MNHVTSKFKKLDRTSKEIIERKISTLKMHALYTKDRQTGLSFGLS